MEFRILGRLEVVAGGEALALGSAQQRAVLALLLVYAPEPVLLDRLIDELWGERPPASAQHAVQVYVFGIRKLLRGARAGGEVVVGGSPSGYVLELDAERVDARRFERLLGAARRVLADDPSQARDLFGQALALWRGPPLAELGQFEFARREADRLEELRAGAVEGLVEARLACGEHGEVIGTINGLVAANPLRERPRRQLMLALYRSGRHAEALGAYRDACAALDEIGLQPGPELRQREQAILRHDAPLTAAAPAADVRGGESDGADRASSSNVGSRELPLAGSVTLLLTDIEGSTQLLDSLGGRYPDLLATHHRVMREAIEATGGYEVNTAGDSFLVAFTTAEAALECAAHAQRALARQQWPGSQPVRVRIGIHTGAPALRDGTYVGMDVHRAARVMAVAHGGQVLITEPTRNALPRATDLLDLGHHRLKDLPAPERLFQLLAADLPGEFPPLRSLNRSNLPSAANPLVGRSSEMSAARGLLARNDVRLVTILGPGGSGKTRLALEVATELVARYQDGVWFVLLAPLADPALVASEVARTLGVKETADEPPAVTLATALEGRKLLLVLDNFEHLIAAADLVSRLLMAAPRLNVLVTSREALNLSGENRIELGGLALADATEFFLARARAVRQDLGGDGDQQRDAVERICLRLDGLPLALELAAARVALFSIPALEARLAQRLALPEGARDLPDRQRTLRSAIDWSYRLLSPPEQALFCGLAPFAGGARLDAIESIFTDLGSEPIETVAALVDKSLLRRRDDADGLPRFWMLETIREHASERATGEGDGEAVADRHAAYFLDLALEGERQLYTSDQSVWLARLEADHDNLRAAFDHLIDREPSGALTIAGALGQFWQVHGHLSEARERLHRALGTAPTEGAAAAKATYYAARLAWLQGERQQAERLFAGALRLAREAHEIRVEVLALTGLGYATHIVKLLEEALAVARGAKDDRILLGALNSLGCELADYGEPERGRPLLEEALELARRLGETRGRAVAAANLADNALACGDLTAAESLIAELLQSAREIGQTSLIRMALSLEALLALHHGKLATADDRMHEALKSVRAAYDFESGPRVLAVAATLATARHEPTVAAQIWAALEEHETHVESRLLTQLREEWLPKARCAVDPAAWEAAWAMGAKLLPEQALDLAATTLPVRSMRA